MVVTRKSEQGVHVETPIVTSMGRSRYLGVPKIRARACYPHWAPKSPAPAGHTRIATRFIAWAGAPNNTLSPEGTADGNPSDPPFGLTRSSVAIEVFSWSYSIPSDEAGDGDLRLNSEKRRLVFYQRFFIKREHRDVV